MTEHWNWNSKKFSKATKISNGISSLNNSIGFFMSYEVGGKTQTYKFIQYAQNFYVDVLIFEVKDNR